MLKGKPTNINIIIYKIIGGKKSLIKKGTVRKDETGNYLTSRYSTIITNLKFQNGEKYQIRVNYDKKNETTNTNGGIWNNREDMLSAWNSISSRDTMEFMETDS